MLHVLSDMLTVIAYYSIPVMLFYFARKRKDLPYPWMLALFGVFILACGTTHLLSAITIWIPLYWLDGIVKVITAITSVATAILMLWLIPRALQLRSPTQLEKEVQQKTDSLAAALAERDQALELLQTNATRLQIAAESGQVGIWDLDLRSYELIWDDTMFALYGVNRAEFSGAYDAWSTRLHPDDRAITEKALQDAIAGKKDYHSEFRVIWPDGEVHYIKGHARVIRDIDGKPLHMIGTNWDNFVHIQTQKKLQLAHAAINKSQNAFFWTSSEGKVSDVNLAGCESLGYSLDELQGQSVGFFDPDFSQEVWLQFWANLKQNSKLTFESRHRRKDGTIFPVEITANYVNIENTEYSFAYVQNISERKQAETLLAESEARFRALFEHTPVAYQSLDIEGRFLHVNQALCDLLGYSEAELLGKDFGEFWLDEYKPLFPSTFNQFKSCGIVGTELTLKHKDGHTVTAVVNGRIQRDTEGKFVRTHCLLTDITARHRAEQYALFQNHILTMALQKTALVTLCEAVVHGLEQLNPDLRCSIMLVDEQGQHLRHSAAPSLPDFYIQAVDGVEIGIGVGSCGTAAVTGERVIVEDIAHHPYWAPYKELAAQAGLAACWSQPIKGSNHQVLGTFGIYQAKPSCPTEEELLLIENLANLLGIALEQEAGAQKLLTEIQHKQIAQVELQESLQRLQKISSLVPGVIYQLRLTADSHFSVPYANERLRELFQLNPASVVDDASALFARIHPDDRDDVLNSLQLSARELTTWASNFRLYDAAGHPRWFAGQALPQKTPDDAVLWHGFIQDIHVRRQTEQELRIAAKVFDSHVGMLVTDAQARILRINQAFTDITGYPADEIIGQTPKLLSSGRHDKAFFAEMWGAITTIGVWEGEIWNKRKSGDIYPEWLTISAVPDENEAVSHYVATFTDISERKVAEEKIQQLAYYDPLTGLANRTLLNVRLRDAMAVGKRSGLFGALIFMDLDNFKPLNDTFGHETGDLLLIETGRRISGCLREVDTVARIGGDEFVVILTELNTDEASSIQMVRTVAEKICSTLSEPYRFSLSKNGRGPEQIEHRCTATLGVALFLGHQVPPDELLKRADAAMYRAKDTGRNQIAFYDQSSLHSNNINENHEADC